MNSADMKLFILCESETQVINVMPFGRLMSSFDFSWQTALYLQDITIIKLNCTTENIIHYHWHLLQIIKRKTWCL